MEWIREQQHRRYNPLTDEWVLVSPHRTARPWKGAQGRVAQKEVEAYDSECYLCPGNRRANGEVNPHYTGPFVFENDYAAMRPLTESMQYAPSGLLRAESEYGICRVLCYAPHHNIHIGEMSDGSVKQVIELWGAQFDELAGDPKISHVQIFENRGEAMGASNPHPHGQIWANESVPYIALRKAIEQHRYWKQHAEPLLCSYLVQELALEERIIYQNEQFVWLVPFWAIWPYESYIIPRRSAADIGQLDDAEREGLAHTLKVAIKTYDKLFGVPFPYSMGLHLPPTPQGAGAEYRDGWQFYIGFYPPLLRSATVRKFMVGYELCAMPQRDITPEQAAKTLRDLVSAPNPGEARKDVIFGSKGK